VQLRRGNGEGGSDQPQGPGGRKPAIVWFRNDLRLHDHEPLVAANTSATSVLPVYCFDPREYGKVRTTRLVELLLLLLVPCFWPCFHYCHQTQVLHVRYAVYVWFHLVVCG